MNHTTFRTTVSTQGTSQGTDADNSDIVVDMRLPSTHGGLWLEDYLGTLHGPLQ